MLITLWLERYCRSGITLSMCGLPPWHPFTFTLEPFMATLKPQSNTPLYNNMVIGTLAVDGWHSEEGTGIGH